MLEKADGSLIATATLISDLPIHMHLWRYMDYFNSSVPSLHDLITGFWKPTAE
jgi:hypothetical protein